MVINAVIAIAGSFLIGFQAAAWATTLAGWAMVALLWIGSRRMGDAASLDARLKRRGVRIVLASIVMGLVLLGTEAVLGDALYRQHVRFGALALLVGAGIVSYFATAQLIGATSFGEIRRAMRRGAKPAK